MALHRRAAVEQGETRRRQGRADPHLRPPFARERAGEARAAARAARGERRPRAAEGGRADVRDEVPPAERINTAYLAAQVRAAAKEALPSMKVITRENMLVLLQASGKDLASCEGECEVDTGRRIGADVVVSGELLKFGTQYKLNMKLHDTRSGELISGTVASGATADALDQNLRPA